MSANWKLIIAVLLLVATGCGMAAYKSLRLGIPFWRGEEVNDWQIEARISFLASGRSVKARLSLPSSELVDPRSSEAGSLGYRFHIERDRDQYTAIWSAEGREERQALFFTIRIPEGATGGSQPVPGKAPEIDPPGLEGNVSLAAERIAKQIRATTSDPDMLVVAMFEPIQRKDTRQEFVLLKNHYTKEHGALASIQMGIDLLGLAEVPARIAYGVKLNEDTGSHPPIPLVEYFDGAAWKIRDPAEPSAIPDDRTLFVWHRGGGPLLDLTGGENSKVSFTAARNPVPLAKLTDLQDSPWLVATLLGLPVSERAVFRYIVLIPLGAFVVVLLRNLVGIPTLGTFMPVLIALALLEIPLDRGLIMFSILIGVGLWCRFLLSRLNLLVVPRVAACVVIVTLLMILMSVISHRLGMAGGIQITLFPMIILAWTIERMSLIWEEEGKRSALTQVGGSLLVAVLAYLFMIIGQVRYWAFYFPELLLVLLAGILLIGRYTGYRLSELIRFKSFQES